MADEGRDEAFERELESAQLLHVRPILSALGAVYIAFAVATAMGRGITNPGARTIMVALNIGGAVILVGGRLWLKDHQLPTAHASTALAAMISLVILTSTVRLYLTDDPLISAIPIMALILSGTVILNRRALLTVALIGITCWLVAFSSSSWSRMWFRSAIGTGSGLFFALFIRRLRMRNFSRDYATRQELTRALARTRDAEIAERKARETAERANLAKSQFLAHISHEIRTPLNAVVGMTSLLLKSELNADQRDYTEIVRDAGEGILALVNDLLDLAKIEANRIVFEKVAFDLREVTQGAVSLLADAAKEKNINVTVEIEEALPKHVMGDPGRTRQILINLLSNAIKFTIDGTVNIRIHRRSTANAPTMLCFEVRDSGVGIAREQQAQLFEAYVQADASISRTYGGTGLGLAIVSQLVTRMGGEIGIDSEVGVGSTFWFTLPYKRGYPSAEPNTNGGANASACDWRQTPELGATILIVDDNPINLRLLRLLLERLGYTSITATGGQEAIESASNPDIQAIIMDIQMPVIDGLKATQAIRDAESASASDRRIPILACTANAQPHERERCISAGMDGYLTKPLRIKALSRELKRHLRPPRKQTPTNKPAGDSSVAADRPSSTIE